MSITAIDRNIIRTVVPAVVGAVVAWVVKEWATLPANDLALLTPCATTLYYMAVRYAEEKFPKLSWLLGCLPNKVEAVPVAPEAAPKA